jgi:hypothetical protein
MYKKSVVGGYGEMFESSYSIEENHLRNYAYNFVEGFSFMKVQNAYSGKRMNLMWVLSPYWSDELAHEMYREDVFDIGIPSYGSTDRVYPVDLFGESYYRLTLSPVILNILRTLENEGKAGTIMITDNPALPVFVLDVEDSKYVSPDIWRETIRRGRDVSDYYIPMAAILLMEEAGFVWGSEFVECLNRLVGKKKSYHNPVLARKALCKLLGSSGCPFSEAKLLFVVDGDIIEHQRIVRPSPFLRTHSFRDFHYFIQANEFSTEILVQDELIEFRNLTQKEKQLKAKHMKLAEYKEKIISNEIASIAAMFQNQGCESVIIPVQSMIETNSSDYPSLIDETHPNHKFMVKQLFLKGLKTAKIVPSKEDEWDYQIIVKNGEEHQVSGRMYEVENELWFDRYDEEKKQFVDNGFCRAVI